MTTARAAIPRHEANDHGTANHDSPPSICTRQPGGYLWFIIEDSISRTYAFVVDRGALAMAYRNRICKEMNEIER